MWDTVRRWTHSALWRRGFVAGLLCGAVAVFVVLALAGWGPSGAADRALTPGEAARVKRAVDAGADATLKTLVGTGHKAR